MAIVNIGTLARVDAGRISLTQHILSELLGVWFQLSQLKLRSIVFPELPVPGFVNVIDRLVARDEARRFP